MKVRTLSTRELAAVLAGLRLAQAHRRKGRTALEAMVAARDIETDGRTLKPLTLAALDALCARLNDARVLVVSDDARERLLALLDEFESDTETFLEKVDTEDEERRLKRVQRDTRALLRALRTEAR